MLLHHTHSESRGGETLETAERDQLHYGLQQTALAALTPSKPLISSCHPALCAMYRSTKGASKARRDQINAEIRSLKELLPIAEADKARLSYLHVMSLACIYTRKSVFFCQDSADVLVQCLGLLSAEELQEMMDALPGFLLLLTAEGKLLYLSDNVSDHLGHSMVDLVAQGDSVYDIVDPLDHSIMRSNLTPPTVPDTDCLFRCRFNTSRSVRRQSTGSKMLLIRARCLSNTSPASSPASYWSSNPVWVCFCSPLEPHTACPTNLYSSFFLSCFRSQHSMDLRLQDAQDSVSVYLGYDVETLRTRSWYSVIHPQDVPHASAQHASLLSEGGEGQVEMVLRVEAAWHVWVWLYMVLQLEAGEDLINSQNHVISEAEGRSLRRQMNTEQDKLSLSSDTLASSPELPAPQPHSSASSVEEETFLQQQLHSASPAPACSPGLSPRPLSDAAVYDLDLQDMFLPPSFPLEPPLPALPLPLPPNPPSQSQSQSQQGKEFLCTPPYTPQLGGGSFLFGEITDSSLFCRANSTPSTVPLSLSLSPPSPSDRLFTEPHAAHYEKLPPTPDSPADGDCTMMTLPEVRGPLYVDVPMGPLCCPPEGLLTPEASPGKQPGLSFFSSHQEERSEISLLAEHLSSLAEGFGFSPPSHPHSSVPSSPSSTRKPWKELGLPSDISLFEESVLETLLDDVSPLCSPSPPLCSLQPAHSLCWAGTTGEAGLLLSGSSPVPQSPPSRLTASPASAPATPALPGAQSFPLEELAILEPVFGAGALIAPGLGQQPELHQLHVHLPSQHFQQDGSGSSHPQF